MLVISGYPFDGRSKVEQVYINGALAHTAEGIEV